MRGLPVMFVVSKAVTGSALSHNVRHHPVIFTWTQGDEGFAGASPKLSGATPFSLILNQARLQYEEYMPITEKSLQLFFILKDNQIQIEAICWVETNCSY